MGLDVDLKSCRACRLSAVRKKIRKIRDIEVPSFVLHNPDLEFIKKVSRPFLKYRNIIIVGNGGSANSSLAMYEALGRYAGSNKKNVVFLTTMEPDYINSIKKDCSRKDTLVIVVSKSGTNIGPIESVLSFMKDNYKIIAITNIREGVLLDIAKREGFPVIEHPDVGGRFSGRTTSSLVPAYLMGIDIDRLNMGCVSMYKRCSPKVGIKDNPALRLACSLHLLEGRGKVDVFMPVYSVRLSGFLALIVQLMHESFGKDGKGQTYFGGLSPETQHHTNQRFFGGRRNIIGLFIRAKRQSDSRSKVSVPRELAGIKLREGRLKDIAGVPYEKALEFEFMGTFYDAVKNNIPAISVSLDKIDAYSAGEFMAFWQYVAVYSSFLRNVNPYDQPQVEASKELSFRMRKAYKSRN